MWDAIGITCRHGSDTQLISQELELLKKKGLFPENVPVLVIDDPVPDIGSGGSTLNALLVIAEHLSASEGHTILQSNIISHRAILVIHLGGPYFLEPCGRAFIHLPIPPWITINGDCAVQVTPFVQLYHTVTHRLKGGQGRRSGVWVCGSDSLLLLDNDDLGGGLAVNRIANDDHSSNEDDITAFTIPTTKSYAKDHGVYKLDSNNIISDVVYRGNEEEIKECTKDDRSDLPLCLAIVCLSAKVGDDIINLHVSHPLSMCTYLGVDSGAVGFKLSLFFDFLLPTFGDVSEEEFVFNGGSYHQRKHFGNRCELRDEMNDLMVSARQSIWNVMSKYKTKAVWLKPLLYHYFENFELGEPLQLLSDGLRRLYPKERVGNPTISHVFHPLLSSSQNDQMFTMRYRLVGKKDGVEEEEESEETTRATFSMSMTPEEAKEVECQVEASAQRSTISHILLHSIDIRWHSERRRELMLEEVLKCAESVLSTQADVCLLPMFKAVCLDGNYQRLLKFLDDYVIRCPLSSKGRGLSCIADVLGILAEGKGGLRSGPAANRHWNEALLLLQTGSIKVGIEALGKVRGEWMDSPSRCIRAARHYEAAAAIYTRKMVLGARQWMEKEGKIVEVDRDKWTVTEAPVRIDIAGGWSDTPPITYEHGGAVVNLAVRIDGKVAAISTYFLQKPVGCKAKALTDEKILIEMIDQQGTRQRVQLGSIQATKCYSDPSAPGSLICAAMFCGGLIDCDATDVSLGKQIGEALASDQFKGIHIICWSNLPQGSGMGTSSILAGCILESLWGVMGRGYSSQTLLHAVKLTDEELHELSERLLLVYTGRTRLAKNLLQEVVRNWFSRKTKIVHTVNGLVENAEQCFQAAVEKDWGKVAECSRVYWEQKKEMAAGSEPVSVRCLLDRLYAEKILINSGWLAGAGGGGFLYLFLQSPEAAEQVKQIILNHPESSGMSIHSVTVVNEGITSCSSFQ